MTKTKIWLIVAALLVLAGAMTFGGVMSSLSWDFNKLSTVEYLSNEYELSGPCESICIDTGTADVSILPYEGDKIKVVCREAENLTHTVALTDGVLSVTLVDRREWQEYVAVSFGTSSVTVYLPEREYAEMSVKQSTGDLQVTGELLLNRLVVAGGTGDVYLEGVVAYDYLGITLSTGDVVLDRCDAGEIDVAVSTGDVTGSLRTDKVFAVKTSTGEIDVPSPESGPLCRVKTSTGDVHLWIE